LAFWSFCAWHTALRCCQGLAAAAAKHSTGLGNPI
jgi:hypothetical protein